MPANIHRHVLVFDKSLRYIILPENTPPGLPSGPLTTCRMFVPMSVSLFQGSPDFQADCCIIKSVLSGSVHLSIV